MNYQNASSLGMKTEEKTDVIIGLDDSIVCK